jgi:signal transduction histidine kinase
MITSLQQLHARLHDAERNQLIDRERQRIAAGLHDTIEQKLFSIGLGINSLIDGADADPSTAERLRSLRQYAVETADEVRKVIFALAAPREGIGDLSLGVRSLLRDLERRLNLATHLVVSGSPPPELGQILDALHSVIREALTNVERHAQARAVLVSIRFDNDRVEVVVQDDGIGTPDLVLVNYHDSYMHFGLRHMRQQILDLGGSFEITGGEECGTTVRVSVPVSHAK